MYSGIIPLGFVKLTGVASLLYFIVNYLKALDTLTGELVQLFISFTSI